MSHFLFLCDNNPDRIARRHGSGPTEAGSALGPDWHEGLVLQGAEQVRQRVTESNPKAWRS